MSTISILSLFGNVRRELNLRAVQEWKKLGLGPKQAMLLLTLRSEPGATQARLAELTATDPSSLGRIIDSLVKAGWVQRKEDPVDRRKWVLHMAPKNSAHMRKLEAARATIGREMVSHLTEEERARLEAILEKILNKLRATGKKPKSKKED